MKVVRDPSSGLPHQDPQSPSEVIRRLPLWGAAWETLYVGSQFGVKLARAGVLPLLLLPAEYGLWASLGVVLSYTRFADFGVQHQLAKRLPLLLGTGDERRFQRLASVGFTWTLVSSLIVAAGLVGVSQALSTDNAGFYRSAFVLLAGIVIAQSVRTVFSTLLQAREEFRAVTVQRIVTDVSALLLAVPGILLAGAVGLVGALLVAELAGAAYSYAQLVRLRSHGLTLTLVGIGPVVREGLLLLIVVLLETQMMVTDQLFALAFLTKAEFGLYAFGAFTVSSLLSLTSVFMVNTPRVLALHAEGRPGDAAELLTANLILFAIFMLAAIPVFAPIVVVALGLYAPHYAPGFALYLLMPIIAIARGPAIVLRSYFFARHEEGKLLRYQTAGVMTSVALCSLGTWLDAGLAALVLASATGYFVLSSLSYRAMALETRTPTGAVIALTLAAVLQVCCVYMGWLVGAGTLWPLVSVACALLIGGGSLFMTRHVWSRYARVYLRGSTRPVLVRVDRWLTATVSAGSGVTG